jgi:hypothetical protein
MLSLLIHVRIRPGVNVTKLSYYLSGQRSQSVCPGNTKGGSINVPLTSHLTGSESALWQLTIFVFYLQNRLFQTSLTGGQQYSDTSPFIIPWFVLGMSC